LSTAVQFITATGRQLQSSCSIPCSEPGHVIGTRAKQFEVPEAYIDIGLQGKIYHAKKVPILDRLRTLEFPTLIFIQFGN
jgi:hypothetical protein